MGRLRAVSQTHRSAVVVACSLAALVLFTFTLAMQSQESASLRGTVHNSQGNPVADAAVHLQRERTTDTLTARTDAQGNYTFPAVRGGVYSLRAESAGYSDAEVRSLFFGPKETKKVDLTLPAKTSALQTAPASAPQFFDPPQFTVAGVTDTTSLGGHGSDTIVRTRETLAKETVSLGKDPVGAHAGAGSETEESLRKSVARAPRSFEANHRL